MKHHKPQTPSNIPTFLFLQVMYLRSLTKAQGVFYGLINPPISDGVCSEFIFYMEDKKLSSDLKFTNTTLVRLY